ncbi:hypothetical protein SAOR_04810 [Salinisphaera orenii MK-B5]|uniref:Uncharacterized protein n=1 Tax=Salinisphaera orenii MK-B5 TaxID=856730 RepID=A0A423PTK6_9GAMM|nr:hypothetical protein SAOR_04810 [Salinisphaera orenii MK-B5]
MATILFGPCAERRCYIGSVDLMKLLVRSVRPAERCGVEFYVIRTVWRSALA